MRIAFVALLTFAGLAAAHGRAVYTVSVAPHATESRVLVGTTYGLLVSDSAGEFRFVCSESPGYDDLIDPKLLWARDGTMFAALPDKLSRSTDNGCNWSEAAGLSATGANSILEDPTASGTYWVTSGKYGQQNALFRSTDGANFSATSLSAASTYFTGVGISPANAQRVYVSAWFNEPLEAWLFRSDDRAGSFSQLTPTLPGKSGFKVLGVHSTNADILFASVLDAQAQSLVLRSVDAGASWTTVITQDDVIRGLWSSPDGHTVYVATARRMFRSNDDGASFVMQPGWVTNACVGGRETELWTCGREVANPYVLGTFAASTPASVTTRLATNQDIKGLMQCPAGTSTGDKCPANWPLTAALLGVPLSPDGGTEVPIDNGAKNIEQEPPPSCGCDATTGSGFALVLAVSQLLRRTRAVLS